MSSPLGKPHSMQLLHAHAHDLASVNILFQQAHSTNRLKQACAAIDVCMYQQDNR